MARKRDYRAEYKRRIESGMARGMTRSQAAGHARAGEPPASQFPKTNPFKQMQDIIKNIQVEIDRIVGPIPKPEETTRKNEVEYEFDQPVYGANPLPAWSTGDESSPPTIPDIKYMIRLAEVHRFQSDYLMIVCGNTSDIYPGHSSTEGCLSYRVPRQELEKYIDRSGPSVEDFINNVIGTSRKEEWVSVTKVKIVDKE